MALHRSQICSHDLLIVQSQNTDLSKMMNRLKTENDIISKDCELLIKNESEYKT